MHLLNLIKLGASKITRRHQLAGLGVLTLLVGVLVLASAVFALHYQNRTMPGVQVAGTLAGGLTRPELQPRLADSERQFVTRPLVVLVNGQQFQFDLAKTVYFQNELTINQAMAIGRNDNIWQMWLQRLKALFGQENVPVQFSFDTGMLQSQIDRVTSTVNITASDANLNFGDTVTISPSHAGAQLDQAELRSFLTKRVQMLSSSPISLNLVVTQPKITSADLAVAQAEATKAVAEPITLTWRSQSWVLDKTKIGSLLSYNLSQPQPDVTIGSDSSAFQLADFQVLAKGQDPTTVKDIHLGIDNVALQDYVTLIAGSINQAAGDPRLTFANGQLQVMTSASEGRTVDTNTLATAILAALHGGNRQVAIPVKVSEPNVDLAHLENLGIHELLASSTSYYAGSSEARIQNISVGSRKVNGYLVAPGDTFSFYRAIGEVTPADYEVGLIIINGRTEPGIGGGICQVSTTLFRAVLNAGLPIIERHPHAYRVHYYEEGGFPPGIDATVYFPGVDFKFKNDTPGWILVQTINNPVSNKLTIELYGTSDGRQTILSPVAQSDPIPAPATLYQPDPTTPKGVTKQVDYSADGLTTVFSRTVTRSGQTILNDTYYTKYQPWQAIFLVGTG